VGLILKIAAGIILAVVVLALLGDTQVTTSLDDTTATETHLTDENGYPLDDIEDVEEPDTSLSDSDWIWVENPKCDDLTTCWQIDVTPPNGCADSIYAELQIVDSNDVAIDSTNATSGAPVAAGQTARLTFDWYRNDDDTGQATGSIAKIECY